MNFRKLPGEEIVRDSNSYVRSESTFPNPISCIDSKSPMGFDLDRDLFLNGDVLVFLEVSHRVHTCHDPGGIDFTEGIPPGDFLPLQVDKGCVMDLDLIHHRNKD